jgi:multiple sugar transport system substrate-binding protein
MPSPLRTVSGWLCLFLAACAATPTPTAPSAIPAVITPSPSASPALTPTPEAVTRPLRVWLPPPFAPDPDQPGGQALADQLAAFEAAHPGQSVEIRLKPAGGAGGLYPALVSAYNVAPDVLPDVIALPPDDLSQAGLAGQLIPLDDLIPADSVSDYYPFAQALSRAGGQRVGAPFAADARILAYNTQLYPSPPRSWADVITGTLIFPGAEVSSLTLLNVYLSLGGALTEPSGQITLDAELLAEALAVFQSAQTAGIVPLSTLAYENPEATWQVFRERRASLAITSAQWYLAERQRVGNSAATLIPTANGSAIALADGWSWAVVNTPAARQAESVELVAWLIEPGRLAAWTEAARVLPPRSQALAQWEAGSLKPFLADILMRAQTQPSAETLARIGPPLRQALDDVLSGRATPFTAATTAAQSVANP